MKAEHCKYTLEFKRPSGTSRGVLTTKVSHFIIIKEGSNHGIGECGLLKGLSIDDTETYEDCLDQVCRNIESGLLSLLETTKEYPSIQFGLEQAFMSLQSTGPFLLFPSQFTNGHQSIPINGLIWMGEEEYMYEQLEYRVNNGFKCIKIKIGALDFDTELRFIESIRKKFPAEEIELRLDANGAFTFEEALLKLDRLSRFHIHSIEQPIGAGQYEAMAEICKTSPIPIALDEELIGIQDVSRKSELLRSIKPQYIILKPSLLGGMASCEQWIELANRDHIGWWVTSALESNIGLNAIAQWTFTLGTQMYQGLGTGSLYVNNFDSPLKIENGALYYQSGLDWPPNLVQELCL